MALTKVWEGFATWVAQSPGASQDPRVSSSGGAGEECWVVKYGAYLSSQAT